MSERQSVGRIGKKEDGLGSSQTKRDFTEPKLTFIEPKLTKHGDATKITAGFFQVFSP